MKAAVLAAFFDVFIITAKQDHPGKIHEDSGTPHQKTPRQMRQKRQKIMSEPGGDTIRGLIRKLLQPPERLPGGKAAETVCVVTDPDSQMLALGCHGFQISRELFLQQKALVDQLAAQKPQHQPHGRKKQDQHQRVDTPVRPGDMSSQETKDRAKQQKCQKRQHKRSEQRK